MTHDVNPGFSGVGRWLMQASAFARRHSARGLMLLASTNAALGQAPPPRTPADEALWSEIAALQAPPASSQPIEPRFDAEIDRRRTLLKRLESYLTAYPGGSHRDDAIRAELGALFEIGALSGGALQPLCERVQQYLKTPPSDAALYEAAYFAIMCDRTRQTAAASQPTSAPVLTPDARLLDAYRHYVRQYPRSRYVPRMAALLFDAAAERGDLGVMRSLAAQLASDFPDHAVTALLAAQVRRADAPGKPFWLTFRMADGERVDTREWSSRPLLIVVWAGFDPAARERVRSIEAYRKFHPEFRAVGVNLDESPDAAALAAADLAIDWPQFNDNLGWANEFAREWGVRRIPHVFVVDRQGRLVGESAGDDWQKQADTAAAN